MENRSRNSLAKRSSKVSFTASGGPVRPVGDGSIMVSFGNGKAQAPLQLRTANERARGWVCDTGLPARGGGAVTPSEAPAQLKGKRAEGEEEGAAGVQVRSGEVPQHVAAIEE